MNDPLLCGAGLPEFQNRIFDTVPLILHVVHQTLRPDELGGQHGQAEENHQPTRARREKHDDSHQQQRESTEDFEKTSYLVDRPKNHDPSQAEGRGAIIVQAFRCPGNIERILRLQNTHLDAKTSNFIIAGTYLNLCPGEHPVTRGL
jgi:hypothetical protein